MTSPHSPYPPAPSVLPPPMVGPEHGPWPPPRPPRPPRQPVALTWPLVGATLVAGVIGDLAFNQPNAHTLAAAAFGLSAVVALRATGAVRTTYGTLFLVAAAVFACFLAIRSDPRLIAFDAIACYLLLIASALFGRGGNPWDVGPHFLGFTAGTALKSWLFLSVDVPLDVAARSRELGEKTSSIATVTWSICRGLVVAVPVVIVLAVLLAEADAVFASFFDIAPLPIDRAVVHLCFFVFATTLVIVAQQRTRRSPEESTKRSGLRLGAIEALVILVGLDLLFLAFTVAQLIGMAGGGDAAIAKAGMTYSEYAREGFFQLLWVAGITLVVLMGLRSLTAASSDHVRSRLWLSCGAAVLTLGIVGVAISRLWLYIADKGQTPLRFYSSVFSIWIGVAFVLVLVRLLGYRQSQAWLAPVLLTSGLITLAGLNLMNPEAFMVNASIQPHPEGTVTLSEKLNADGVAALANRLDELPADVQASLTKALCYRQSEFDQGSVLAFNWSERQAGKALDDLCRQ